ncbi:MAG: hypothetical protein ACRD0L_04825, partial [Acidimicrobiales bacterium]
MEGDGVEPGRGPRTGPGGSACYRGCPPGELGEVIDQVHGLMLCAEGELIGLIGALEDSGAYAMDG